MVIVTFIIGSLAFPVFARAYVANSIPTVAASDPLSGNGTDDDSWVPSADVPEGLGIRELPILTNEATYAWELGAQSAMDTFGERLFGNNWAAVMEAATVWGESGQSINNIVPGQEYGPVGALINAALAEATTSEALVLDVIGLSVLLVSELDATSEVDPLEELDSVAQAVLAFGLSEAAASKFGGCDSLLTRAHIFALGLEVAIENIEPLWNDAIESCGADPSATVLFYRSLVGMQAYYPDVTMWNSYGGHFRDWTQARADAAFLVEQYPSVPAAHVVAGDIFSQVAEHSSDYGPFTSREWQQRARAEYRAALELGYAPEVVLAASPGVAGLESVRAPANTYDVVLHAQASVTATAHDYTEAVAAEQAALAASPPPRVPVAVQSSYYQPSHTLSSTTPLGAWPTSLNLFYGYGFGAGGSVESREFVPQSRPDGGDLVFDFALGIYYSPPNSTLIRLTLLAGDWSLGTQACALVLDNIPSCEVAAALEESVALTSWQFDFLQNLYRTFDDLEGARLVTTKWAAALAGDPLARERLGEIAVLAADWTEASEQLTLAVNLYGTAPSLPDYPYQVSDLLQWSGVEMAALKLASAQRAQQQFAEALTALDQIDTKGSPPLLHWTELERSQIAYAQQDFTAAITHTRNSIWYRSISNAYSSRAPGFESLGFVNDNMPIHLAAGPHEQLLGLSYFATANYDQALYWAQQALVTDPFSPLYLETVADATRAGGVGCAVVPTLGRVVVTAGTNVRPTPHTANQEVGFLDTDAATYVEGFTYGENVRGNNTWFRVALGWVWSGALAVDYSDGDVALTELNENGLPKCAVPIVADDSIGVETPPGNTPPNNESPSSGADAARYEMIAAYRTALGSDNTLFSSWNNLGVLLQQTGDNAGAVEAFENAVRSRTDYPLGWFNLGVMESGQSGLWHFVRAEGALGKAGSLNAELKNQEPVLRFDDEVYSSGVDVSKEIPADWHLGQSARSNPATLTIGLIVLVIFRVVWELGKDWFAGVLGEHALGGKRPKWLSTLAITLPWWPLTAAVSLIALLYLSGAQSLGELMLCGGLATVLLGLHAFAPSLMSTVPLRNVAWPSASLLTGLLAVVGLGFAPPPPFIEAEDVTPVMVARNHRIAIIAVGVVAVLLSVIAIVTAVPMARANAIIALILVSSALLPVHPMDGAQVNFNRLSDLGITVALAGGTASVALNWL
ncbi:MAG: hypothetical protein LBJ43_02380 [Propionibacteriaceae bacterium]|nr:hypothetical protein [Propionibacteriaceae bacterium]